MKSKLLGNVSSAGAGKKKKGGAGKAGPPQKTMEERNAETEKMLSEWALEKEALTKEKEIIMAQSKELQDKIKALKEAQQQK
jgi:hypothetical protein